MADEIWNSLMRFHREVAVPEIVGPLRDEIASSRREALSNFDALYTRFDRLESDYQSLDAAVSRVEEKLDHVALRSELLGE